jgi:alkaline phosphatase D
MAVTMRAGAALTRRRFLTTAASAGVLTTAALARPALSRAADRPVVTHGIQSGDTSTDSGIVWARVDRPARMLVEVATTDSFRNVHSSVFVDALPESDFTAKALIEGLPAGHRRWGIFAPRRANGAAYPSCGRAIPPAAAGASTRRAAACAPTRPC